MKLLRYALLVCLPALTPMSAASLSLSNAALFGQPGDTVGWGFSLTSTTITDGALSYVPWLLVTSVDFIPDFGQSPIGVFTPYLTVFPNSATVIGPDAGNGEVNPWSQSFDATTMTGIGSYDINSFQSAGDSVTGAMVVTYDTYRHSPNDAAFDPISDTVSVGESLRATASVTVGAETPEPGTLMLLGLGLLVLGMLRRCYFSDSSYSRTTRSRSSA